MCVGVCVCERESTLRIHSISNKFCYEEYQKLDCRPVDMILLQATDSNTNTAGEFFRIYLHCAHVHCVKANNNRAAAPDIKIKTTIKQPFGHTIILVTFLKRQ